MKHEDLVPIIEDILRDCKPFLSMIGYDPKYIPVRDMGSLSLSYDDDIIQHFKTRPDRLGKRGTDYTKQIIENTFKDKNIPSRYRNAIIASSLGKNTLFGFDEDQACYIIPKGKFTYAYIANDFNSGSFDTINSIYVRLYNILSADELSAAYSEFHSSFELATIDQLENISKKSTNILKKTLQNMPKY